MHVTSKRVVCNCHEVSKVSSGGRLVYFLYGDRRESSRESFNNFFAGFFSLKGTLLFICIKVLAGPHKSLYLIAFVRK